MAARKDRQRGTAGRGAEGEYRRARRLGRRRRVEVTAWLVVAAGALVVACTPTLPTTDRGAGVATALGLLVVAVVRRPPADPDRWRRGAAGEVATADLLADLSGRRWAVLHDRRLPGSRANVDHLVIGRRGVWVLDSKAFRAPVRAGLRGVRVGDRRLDTSAVAWEASVVADRLGVEVRPLVVVHTDRDGARQTAPADAGARRGRRPHRGRLPYRGRRCGGVRVLPAEAVVAHLRRARGGSRLRRADIAALAERAALVLPEA